MIDPSQNIAKHLDYQRRLATGIDTELIVLGINKARGYDALVTVTTGWNLEDGDIDVFQTLIIVEYGDVSREVLEAARLFSIGGKVYKIQGDIRKESPNPGNIIKKWKFPVVPSGEQYP